MSVESVAREYEAKTNTENHAKDLAVWLVPIDSFCECLIDVLCSYL